MSFLLYIDTDSSISLSHYHLSIYFTDSNHWAGERERGYFYMDTDSSLNFYD